MDDLKRLQDNVELAIDNQDNMTSQTSKPTEPPTIRDRLDHLIHSHKFNVAVIVLVALDCTMVIAVLLFDLEIVTLEEEHHFVPKIFHYTSVAILSLFLVELGIRLYVLRLAFFRHKLEVFDAFVVIISFVLDIVFRDNEDASSGVGLLILLRLWRITRIVNGIVMSVKKKEEEKREKEKHMREICQENVSKYETYCKALEDEIDSLKGALKKNNVDYNEMERPKLDLTEMPQQNEEKSKANTH